MLGSATMTFLTAFLVGCTCNDLEIRAIPNEPPEVDILTHDDGDTELEAFTVTFRANVLDDDPVDESIATWFLDDDVVCEGAVPAIGTAECGVVMPDADSARVRVEVRDLPGAVGTDKVEIQIDPTFPPDVDILSPVSDHRYYRNVDVVMEALLNDPEDAPTLLTASWASDVDGVLAGAVAMAGDDGVATTAAPLTQGPHSLTVTATDSTGKMGTDSVNIDVGGDNHAPSCSIVAPEDGSIQTIEQPISLEGRADDEDLASPSELTVAWSTNIEGPIGNSTPDVYGIVYFTTPGLVRGVHTVTMTVVDDAGWTCEATRILSVTNEPPTAPVVQILPDVPVSLENIVCTIKTQSDDPEGAPLSYQFTWLRDGAPFYVTSTTFLPGDTIDADFIAPGQTWTCEARAYDGIGTGDAGIDVVEVVAPLVVSIAVGEDHSCQVDDAITATCWGEPDFGKLGLTGVVVSSMAPGSSHTCALDPDGEVLCVGNNDLGQTDVTGLVGPFTQLEAGEFFNCALDVGQGIQCWGSDSAGQVSGAPVGNFIDVSAGFQSACAIETDNDVKCWGSDAFGKATPPAGIKMSAISAGREHSCGIDLAGVLHCWGKNNVLQATPPLGSFASLSAGMDHSCAVDGDDTIHCWGIYTDFGELNAAPAGTFSSVAVYDHSCAVDLAGTAVCWGDDTHGEATPPTVWW